MYDIVIIGAGVVGGLIARKLTEYNFKICILEKENDVAMGATRANSAIIHAGFDAQEGSLKAQLNVAGSKMMKKVCQELGVKYQNNGALVIGFTEEDKKTIEKLYERGQKNGVDGLKVIEKSEVKQIEPNISEDVICALYAPSSSIICPYELTIAAIGNAMDNGAELKLSFKVSSIEEKNGVYRIYSDKEEVEAKVVINAAGVFSDEIAKMINDTSFQIKPRRGEYILLDKECGNIIRHTIFRTPSEVGKGILISPTVDGNLLLGPTSVEVDNKNDNGTTAEGFQKIIEESNENINSVPLGKTITSFCGLRATGSTGDFIINSPKQGFVNVAGIESPGLSASPAIAEYIVGVLEQQGVLFEKNKNFNPYRQPMHLFKDMSIAEKNEIIAHNPAYGKIVCRCENVTEGEILDALRNNPKARDLDGVKRRTRAQMGRCQGGFCGPYITELIANELGISCENVTKFGGESHIIIGKTKGEL